MSGLMLIDDLVTHLTVSLRVTEPEFASIVGAQPRTVERWRSGERFPQHDARRRLDDLSALVERLHASFKTPEGATVWLHTESGYFGGLKPIDALLRGRIDLVDAALEALDSGAFV